MDQVSAGTDTFGKPCRGGLAWSVSATRGGASMIIGGHVVIHSKDAEADRALFRNVLKFPYVDAHGGWLIFKLPPSEAAFHPSDENDMHELFLMTDDLDGEMKALKKAGVACEEPSQQSWGRMTKLTLPGGGTLGLYQPRHARP